MLERALERLVSRLTTADDGDDLDRARGAFEARTGAFAAPDACHEARIGFFLDWYLCAWRSADGTRPAERALSERGPAGAGPLDDDARRVARAYLSSARSLYRASRIDEAALRLEDLLGGGRFRVAPDGRLREGDLFDGRLLVLGGDALDGDRPGGDGLGGNGLAAPRTIRVAPGIIFHPPETHEPLNALVTEVRAAPFDRVDVLDGLLRMLMRLDRFTSIRPRHLYRLESLYETDILSAGWAKRPSTASK